jgi:hypothetical protein
MAGKPRSAPSWTREPLVACVGGPFDGQWFTEDQWRTRRDATERMQQIHTGRPAPTLDYHRTRQTESHPEQFVPGTVWRYAA